MCGLNRPVFGLFHHIVNIVLLQRAGGEGREGRRERPRRLQGKRYEKLRMGSKGHQYERV